MTTAPAATPPPDTRGVRVFQPRTGAMMFVFTPTHARQFRAGFEPGRWYFAPSGDLATRPKSCTYGSREAAVAAVNAPLGEFAAV